MRRPRPVCHRCPVRPAVHCRRRSRPGNQRCSEPAPAREAQARYRDLFQDRLVELSLGQQLLQPSVLTLELFQPFRIVSLHAAILRHPPSPRGLSDRELPADLLNGHTASKQFLALGQLPDDLFWCVTSTRHQRFLSCPHHNDADDQDPTTPGSLSGSQRTTSATRR